MLRFALCLICFPTLGHACDRPICLADANQLIFAQEITFDDQPSGMGPGRTVSGVLALDGASFGERFAGQIIAPHGNFDRVIGRPAAPLTLIPGIERQNMTVIRLAQTNVLSGEGGEGFPNHQSTGEGAIAVLFDRDQTAMAFDIRGGEGGQATVVFLRRDGSTIDRHVVSDLAEIRYGFIRSGGDIDIAGLIITNDDPDGIAIDNVAFDGVDQTS